MAKGKPITDHRKRINRLTELIKSAKTTDSLYELNEHLRKLVMGPFGDTKFDTEDIKNLHKKNEKWRKRSTKKGVFKNNKTTKDH